MAGQLNFFERLAAGAAAEVGQAQTRDQEPLPAPAELAAMQQEKGMFPGDVICTQELPGTMVSDPSLHYYTIKGWGKHDVLPAPADRAWCAAEWMRYPGGSKGRHLAEQVTLAEAYAAVLAARATGQPDPDLYQEWAAWRRSVWTSERIKFARENERKEQRAERAADRRRQRQQSGT